jgi:uncharacterized damage-inducible protein DinB
MDLLDRLLDHDHWATTQLLDLCRNLTAAQFDQSFDVGHQNLHSTFGHLISNVEFWTASMTGQPADRQKDDELPAMVERYERAHATLAAFARRIRDEDRLDDTFPDHFGYPMTYGGAILHVLLHDEDHRVEMLHILQRLGIPDLPELDHGLWDFKRRGF